MSRGVSCADQSPIALKPGKIRGTSLPQEYYLSILIQHMSDNRWLGKEGHACEWNGVGCNAERIITDLRWSGCGLRGTVPWEHIPETVLSLDFGKSEFEFGEKFSRNNLQGTVNWGAFPRMLRELSLSHNKFEGEILFAELPATLRKLNLKSNRFSGVICFETIPKDLVFCDLTKNRDLRGKLDQTKLGGSVRFNVAHTMIAVL
eukprot:CAMPEP_0201480282 /NCGR_PEP_ID=MMETSP0151_2-20130828/4789_1 /ASSEMBLY_ACC=CAM_ASM_000257 /TAXON_ID=200890 /ORGANISM="Paramoeba atlantica, Strain 621/1 / CCAP 1560/9" /LENGTH=203 /DNA_ID=CAMNT_0047862083 /DNA_START=73 /DNA_END=684 /DNA_ORIENTATION=+